MHESPQCPTRSFFSTTLNEPGAQAVPGAVIADAAMSRVPGHTFADLVVILEDGTRLYVQRIRLMPTSWGIDVASSPEALHFNLSEAVNRESRRLIHAPAEDTDESFTDESVLEEVAESQRQAHAQLYGGAE
jgi:hypothetical protein